MARNQPTAALDQKNHTDAVYRRRDRPVKSALHVAAFPEAGPEGAANWHCGDLKGPRPALVWI